MNVSTRDPKLVDNTVTNMRKLAIPTREPSPACEISGNALMARTFYNRRDSRQEDRDKQEILYNFHKTSFTNRTDGASITQQREGR